LVPGTLIADYHKEVGHIMESELIKLKLIDATDIKNQRSDWPAYKKYFMHGTSHFLGLDTHDLGLYQIPIQANMVFTCEPGIYIPQEGLGIRIEDDLVVRDNAAPFNLMGSIPILIEEIEALMNE
jgi:Xaa-Pro aminopeptidase